MGIIGASGLLLWFPEFFGRVMPGWVFNVAMLIHGEEALLAVGFIFTMHFFNGHLRPEKFPMDTVIFTGRVTHGRNARSNGPTNWRGSNARAASTRCALTRRRTGSPARP